MKAPFTNCMSERLMRPETCLRDWHDREGSFFDSGSGLIDFPSLSSMLLTAASNSAVNIASGMAEDRNNK